MQGIAYIEFAGTLICSYLIICNAVNYLFDKDNKEIYGKVFYIYTMIALSFTCEAVASLSFGIQTSQAYYTMLIATSCELILNQLCQVIIVREVIHIIEYRFPVRRIEILLYMLLAVYCILVLTNPWTGWLFTISSNTCFVPSKTNFLSMLPSLLIQIACILYFWHARSRMYRPFKVFVFLLSHVPVSAAALQFFYGALPLELAALLFCALLFNFYQHMIVSKKLINVQKSIDEQEKRILVAQLQPHFMYNALMAIMQIEGNPPETVKALTGFSHYLRGNLNAIRNSELIPVAQELKHVKAYLRLEELRYQGKLKVEYDIREEGFRVPPLSLEMLVENSIRHGFASMADEGVIKICTSYTDGWYIASIEDNGAGMDESILDSEEMQNGNHVGIRNVRDRLVNMCGGQLLIHSVPGEGTRVSIMIPHSEKKQSGFNV